MNQAPKAPASAQRTRVSVKLDDAQREWIVRRLAAHESPTAIRRDLRERFGIAVSLKAIAHYDPTRHRQHGRRWADLFVAVRKDHMGSTADLTAGARQVERVALRIVEILERRLLEGRGGAARGCAKAAGAITDEDRLHALMGFVARLRITDPAAAAGIRRLLIDDRHATEVPHAG